MFENRIGKKTAEGREFPAFDITGATYERVACTTCSLGDGVHFVVLPVNFTDETGLIEQAKAWISRSVTYPDIQSSTWSVNDDESNLNDDDSDTDEDPFNQ
jgi:hypothetical protein